jgi:glycosyltransferase involved in cell wall biosynthesis
LGEISHKKVGQVLNDCDAVLFPSLLETYGIPYYEAMYFSKPLIVSDLDFARDACGDAAIYFDPLNAVSIVEAMRKMVFGVELGKNVKNNYKAKLDKIPTWEEFVDFFHQEVTSI